MWRPWRQNEGDLSAELQSHLEMHIADNMRAGMTPEEARRQALVALGGIDQAKERYRDMFRFAWVDAFHKDVQFGFRAMRRSAGLTVLAIVTLAVGIAATNTAFTIMNAVLIRDMPFDDPDRIVAIGMTSRGGDASALSYADFKDWERATRSFVGIAAIRTMTMNVSDHDRAPERFLGSYVSARTFRLLRLQPALGRDFTADEDRDGAAPVVILSHRAWKDRYASDPEILGRTIRINTQPATVIGVMPEGMEFPTNSAVWQPLAMIRGLTDQPRDARTLGAFGRLADGVSAVEAAAELDAMTAALARDYPQTNSDTGAGVERFRPGIGRPWYVVFGALMSAVALLLLVSCANIINLLLSRSLQRTREVAIRASLGATRTRIVRQLLVESVMLAAAAGLVALPASAAAIRLFVTYTDEIGRPFWMNFSMDAAVFVFLCAVCLGTGIVFGLAPALHLSRSGAGDALREASSRTATAGRWMRGWSATLVIAEVVLTLVLVTGAVSMMRFALAESSVRQEIDTSRILTMTLRLPAETYPVAEDRTAFYRRLEERVAGMVSVSSVAVAGVAPLLTQSARELSLDGRGPIDGQSLPRVDVVNVGIRYFETIGLRVVRGRILTDDDGASGRESVIVDQRFADRFFPQRDPLGATITLLVNGRSPSRMTVAGVVPSLRQSYATEIRPMVYLPFLHEPPSTMTLIARLRTESDAPAVAAMLREEVRALDADLPLYDVRTLDEVLNWSMWINRVFGGMFAIFASIAVIIATVGIYGVVAYTMTQRTQEIGIRMALGAPRGRLWWTMMGSKIAQVAFGLAVGVTAAFVLLGLMGGLLVGRFGQDPITFAVSGVFLLVMSVLAMLWPIWRATSRGPVAALRYE
ncbi:MAG TPA: ABC transporter permease [Vicinamibacterales bacterium]